jgi:hypothetical protein
VVIFFLFGGLATQCFQLESYAQISGEDFALNLLNDSTSSSAIRSLRVGSRKLGAVPARTATAFEISFPIVLPYRSAHLPAHGSRQNLHTFKVVLRL